MGEARRKVDADACGKPRPRDNKCPACGSRRIKYLQAADFPSKFEIDCELGACLECKAIWEAFPPSYVRDPVCADPCDNCAFRPGSPEQRDPVQWKAMIEKLKPDGEQFFTGRFYCHKGVQIDMTKGPGNFLFPTKPILMDGEPIKLDDGSIATMADDRRMRVCSGFLRMFWARIRKEGSDV
jgi:hypothetical protein